MKSTNTIFIGDIHGCAREFQELLQRISPSEDDEVVLMGDLVNKGPDPAGVLKLFEAIDGLCLRGNHECNHLDWRAGIATPKAESVATARQMGEQSYRRYLEMAARTPLFYETPEVIAVHGAVVNGFPLNEQPEKVLTGEITLDESWKDYIDLDRPLVVGHKRYHEDQSIPFIIEGKFYGIDTGCIYGGCLTALVMPSGKIIQVKASRDYSSSREPALA